MIVSSVGFVNLCEQHLILVHFSRRPEQNIENFENSAGLPGEARNFGFASGQPADGGPGFVGGRSNSGLSSSPTSARSIRISPRDRRRAARPLLLHEARSKLAPRLSYKEEREKPRPTGTSR